MTLSFRHAFVALDQSGASDFIVSCLPHFRKSGTRNVTLFTSVSVPNPGGISESVDQTWRNKPDEYAGALESMTKLEVSIRAAFDINAYAPHQNLKAAHETEADFIIISNRGQSKYRDLLLGCTATELLQH